MKTQRSVDQGDIHQARPYFTASPLRFNRGRRRICANERCNTEIKRGAPFILITEYKLDGKTKYRPACSEQCFIEYQEQRLEETLKDNARMEHAHPAFA